MRINTILVPFCLVNLSMSISAFFWVPNRYTAPFWSHDTHITNHCIDSVDLYWGRSYATKKNPDYTTIDAILSWYQTIASGFFGEITMPITKIRVKNNTELLAGLNNGFCYENCTLLGGWGINHDDIPILDFVDCMIRLGVATPAHTPALDEFKLETLYGYSEWGFPAALDLAIGICDWMTFGFHTSVCQFKPNPLIWHIQPYFKADHFLIGLSGYFGYSYTTGQNDSHSPLIFVGKENWSMHTLHYGFEYEFIQSYFPLHPRLGAYYNHSLGGTHSLLRSNIGVTLGLDVSW